MRAVPPLGFMFVIGFLCKYFVSERDFKRFSDIDGDGIKQTSFVSACSAPLSLLTSLQRYSQLLSIVDPTDLTSFINLQILGPPKPAVPLHITPRSITALGETIRNMSQPQPHSGPSSLNVNVKAAQNYGRSRPSSPTTPLYQTSPKPKADDYVYFERRPQDNFTSDAVARATAAKLKLESYYKVAVDAAIERNARCVTTDDLTE